MNDTEYSRMCPNIAQESVRYSHNHYIIEFIEMNVRIKSKVDLIYAVL